MSGLVIVGAGGHGRVVLDAAIAAGIEVSGFIADPPGDSVNGVPVLGPTAMLDELLSSHRFIVAIGEQDARRDFSIRIGDRLQTVIHPAAWISPSAKIGRGTAIIAGAIVNANAEIGDFCILNTGCSVDHDNKLADGVQVCPGAHLAGNVSVGEDAFIGTGASLVPGIRIGARAVVGAGAVVVSDLPGGSKAVGNPARF